MIFGDPYFFCISFDVAYPSENLTDSNIELGIFNFIIEDVFFPGKGGNWTLSMIISHLKEAVKEGWYKMIGPNANLSQKHLWNKKGGSLMPKVNNIKIIDKK